MPSLLEDWTVKKSKYVMVWLLIGFIMACIGFKNVSLDVSYKSFFDSDDALLIAMNHQENTYSKYDNMLVVVGVEEGDIFSPSSLHAYIN